MDSNDGKSRFLRREFFILSWGASIQHNPTYAGTAAPSEKDGFRDAIRRYVTEKVEPLYQSQVTDDAHFANLEGLMEYAAEVRKSVLEGGVYKSANAQKLLNLFLKYLWCSGIIETPPTAR